MPEKYAVSPGRTALTEYMPHVPTSRAQRGSSRRSPFSVVRAQGGSHRPVRVDYSHEGAESALNGALNELGRH